MERHLLGTRAVYILYVEMRALCRPSVKIGSLKVYYVAFTISDPHQQCSSGTTAL